MARDGLTPAQRLLIAQLEPQTRAGRFLVLPEYRFAPPRRWRIDVAVHEYLIQDRYAPCLAIEIDGGAYIAGRHTRGAGVEADNEKIAALAKAGYRFIRVTPKQVRNGTAYRWILEAL